jgi:hypothetical protein
MGERGRAKYLQQYTTERHIRFMESVLVAVGSDEPTRMGRELGMLQMPK